MPHYWGEHLWATPQGACQFCCCFRHLTMNLGVYVQTPASLQTLAIVPKGLAIPGTIQQCWYCWEPTDPKCNRVEARLHLEDLLNVLKHRGLKACVVTEAHTCKSESPNVFSSLFFLFDLSHLLWIVNIFYHSSIYLDCLNVATVSYTFESGRVEKKAQSIPISLLYLFRTLLQFRAHAWFILGRAVTYWCWF